MRAPKSPRRPLASSRLCAHRLRAHLLAACVFLASMLACGTLNAQKVLLAPEIELGFETLAVQGSAESIAVDYELREHDWRWTQDFGLDLWLGIYTPSSGDQDAGPWNLERATPLAEQNGSLELTSEAGRDGRIGVCLIAATEGGRLAPGMGYVCEQPVSVAVSGGEVDRPADAATVSLRFERHVDEQPWFGPQTGFDTMMARAEGGAVERDAKDFIVYEPPQPRQEHAQRRSDAEDGPPQILIRDASSYDDRRAPRGARYGRRGLVVYVPGYLSRGRFDHSVRDDIDRFRRRRLERRRLFGPFDIFDAKFDQDMFSRHPEDVFHRFRHPPGPFGRDAFGRPFREAVPSQRDAPEIDVFRRHP